MATAAAVMESNVKIDRQDTESTKMVKHFRKTFRQSTFDGRSITQVAEADAPMSQGVGAPAAFDKGPWER